MMRLRDVGKLTLTVALAFLLATPQAVAGKGDRDWRGYDGRGYYGDKYDCDDDGRDDRHGRWRDDDDNHRKDHYVRRHDRHDHHWGKHHDYYRAPSSTKYVDRGHRDRHWDGPPASRRVYRDVVIARPYGYYATGTK